MSVSFQKQAAERDILWLSCVTTTHISTFQPRLKLHRLSRAVIINHYDNCKLFAPRQYELDVIPSVGICLMGCL